MASNSCQDGARVSFLRSPTLFRPLTSCNVVTDRVRPRAGVVCMETESVCIIVSVLRCLRLSYHMICLIIQGFLIWEYAHTQPSYNNKVTLFNPSVWFMSEDMTLSLSISAIIFLACGPGCSYTREGRNGKRNNSPTTSLDIDIETDYWKCFKTGSSYILLVTKGDAGLRRGTLLKYAQKSRTWEGWKSGF